MSDLSDAETERLVVRRALGEDEPEGADGGAGVFVIAEDERRNLIRGVGWGLAALVCTWLFLVVASLTGASWVPKVSLPGLGPIETPHAARQRVETGPKLQAGAAKVEGIDTTAEPAATSTSGDGATGGPAGSAEADADTDSTSGNGSAGNGASGNGSSGGGGTGAAPGATPVVTGTTPAGTTPSSGTTPAGTTPSGGTTPATTRPATTPTTTPGTTPATTQPNGHGQTGHTTPPHNPHASTTTTAPATSTTKPHGKK